MYRDTLGGIAMDVDERAAPLVDLLTRIGVEIGSVKLAAIARLASPLEAAAAEWADDDVRVVCVGFPSPVAALALIDIVRESLSADQLCEIGPFAVVKAADHIHLAVFAGAIGWPADTKKGPPRRAG
jgi:hypothetical protein